MRSSRCLLVVQTSGLVTQGTVVPRRGFMTEHAFFYSRAACLRSELHASQKMVRNYFRPSAQTKHSPSYALERVGSTRTSRVHPCDNGKRFGGRVPVLHRHELTDWLRHVCPNKIPQFSAITYILRDAPEREYIKFTHALQAKHRASFSDPTGALTHQSQTVFSRVHGVLRGITCESPTTTLFQTLKRFKAEDN